MIDGSRHHADLLGDLSAPQQRAVTSEATPLCVLAAAGAGKTRVLTRRIAYRSVTGTADPAHVLALTFTRKAATELATRLRHDGLRDRVATGTFHAIASAQLRRWWADRGQAAPVLLERKSRLLGPIVAERPGLAGVGVGEVAGHIEWARARLVAPGDFAAVSAAQRRALPAAAEDLAAVFERYEHEKRRRGLIDFDDLLSRCADVVERDPAFAAAQRWRWRHVFVDEYQDVNPLQQRLLLAWLGDNVDVCIVGDPNQAIYGWNGADPGLLDGVARRWPTTEVVRLDANHRCTPQIVAAAARVLAADGDSLVASRPDGAPVTVRSWPSEHTEAAGVAAALREAHGRGLAWSRCAVLVRTNSQAGAIADACRTEGVPVRAPGGGALLDDPVVRRACATLRGRPGAPLRVAVADLDAWSAGGASDPSGPFGLSATTTPSALTAPSALTTPAPAPGLDASLPVLAVLADLGRQAARLDATMSVGAWLDWLPAALGRDPDAATGDAVTVCSFHRAKGLEWSSVWVCGLETGLVPIGRAVAPGAEAEERRLLYVALTRARDELHCSWAAHRSFGAGTVRRLPSPWLALIGPDATAVEVPPPPSRHEWQRRLTEQRDRLRAGGPPRRRPSSGALQADWPVPDEGLLDALRAWRAGVARAAAVPAHIVLHDTVLTALAALRPDDREALASVPGLGAGKAERYGDRLLALVSAGAVPA